MVEPQAFTTIPPLYEVVMVTWKWKRMLNWCLILAVDQTRMPKLKESQRKLVKE